MILFCEVAICFDELLRHFTGKIARTVHVDKPARVEMCVKTATRTCKNVNFLGSLSRFPVGGKLKTIAFYDVTKRSYFLENIALQTLRLCSLWSTWINSHSAYKQLHRHSVIRYCSVCKNKTLTECKSSVSGKSLPQSGRFSHRILACGNQEALYWQIVNAHWEHNVLCGHSFI